MRTLLRALLLSAFLPVSALHSQGSTSSGPPGPVITGRDLAWIGAATLGSALVSKIDVPVARAFSDSAMHLRHPGFVTAAKRASLATETVLMITGGTVWGIARLKKDEGTADVALHATESVASAAMVIQVVRGVLGRARPYVVNDSGEVRDADPYDFQLLHGFTSFNYRSWPSMHAMASFAAASALSQEMRFRNTEHRAVISPALYAAAAMPSLGRMILDEHWSSDIAMGIFLGVLSGQKVVQYSHSHPDNPVDRRFLPHHAALTATFDVRGWTFGIAPM